MFSMLTNLTKATIAVAIVPVDLIIDVVTLPASGCDPQRGVFDHTAKRLQQASKAVDTALRPDRSQA